MSLAGADAPRRIQRLILLRLYSFPDLQLYSKIILDYNHPVDEIKKSTGGKFT